jgi:hypothetical protein
MKEFKIYKFEFYKSVHHRAIQINHQPDATIFQFIILAFIYSSTCFGLFPPIIRSSMTAVAASGLPSYRGDSRAVFVVGPAGHEHSGLFELKIYT